MSILRKGMRGAPVKRLQEKLGIAADGIFGPGTERAVRDYQASAGLATDGIAGPDTFGAMGLQELVLLRVGIRGATVRKLQEALGIAADGAFGPATERAVRAFQEANGLDVDGLAGPETLARLDGFAEITEKTVGKAALRPDEQHFESEPMPKLDGSKALIEAKGPGQKKSVWRKMAGW